MEGGHLGEKDHTDDEDPDVVLEKVLAIHETDTVANHLAVSVHFEHARVAGVAVVSALRLQNLNSLLRPLLDDLLLIVHLLQLHLQQIKFILIRALLARLVSQFLAPAIQSQVVHIILILIPLFQLLILSVAFHATHTNHIAMN